MGRLLVGNIFLLLASNLFKGECRIVDKAIYRQFITNIPHVDK